MNKKLSWRYTLVIEKNTFYDNKSVSLYVSEKQLEDNKYKAILTMHIGIYDEDFNLLAYDTKFVPNPKQIKTYILHSRTIMSFFGPNGILSNQRDVYIKNSFRQIKSYLNNRVYSHAQGLENVGFAQF